MKATRVLSELGQSLWLDHITRDLLDSGTLQRYVDDMQLFVASVRPGPGTKYDEAAWTDSIVAYGGQMHMLLAGRYRYDDPYPAGKIDDQWYWSENHLLIGLVNEFLAGSRWRDATFTISGLKGAEHAARSRQRILDWIHERARFGFFEWHSHVYMKKNVTPLLTLIELADDPDLVLAGTMGLVRKRAGREPVQVHALPATIEALRTHIFNGVIWPDFTRLPTRRHPVIRPHRRHRLLPDPSGTHKSPVAATSRNRTAQTGSVSYGPTPD